MKPTSVRVDALARKGSLYQQDFMIFDSPPMDILMLLYYDSIAKKERKEICHICTNLLNL